MTFVAQAARPRVTACQLITLRPAEPAGLARLCADPDGVAGEFLILVHASARGRGLGRLLVERMLADCRHRGLLLVRATALPGNAAMLALARACRFQLLPGADGTVELVRALPPVPREDAW